MQIKNLLKPILCWLLPELYWKELDAGQMQSLLSNLENSDAGREAAAFIQQRRVRVGCIPQKYSGGGWTLTGNVTLLPGADPATPGTAVVVIHEVTHLRQPLLKRLSVGGELEAWQVEYHAYAEITGRELGANGTPFAGTGEAWRALAAIKPAGRNDERKVRALMKEIAPSYRARWLLPGRK